MATGKTNAGGGGGASLNFDVKAYATEAALLAATPKENTIGVITSTAITGWYFTATQPENMANGDVWFQVGMESPVQFNVLKKNTLEVYPLRAKQMVSGALVDVTASTYLDGDWVDWVYYIVDGSNVKITNISNIVWSVDNSGLKITRASASGSPAPLGITSDVYDLTRRTKLTVKISFASSSGKELWISFCSTKNSTRIATLKMSTGGTYTLDVSSINQPCRILFDVDLGLSATISKMHLE